MDGLAADADITFILTTNRADLLERALVERPGRVDLAVEITKPDLEAPGAAVPAVRGRAARLGPAHRGGRAHRGRADRGGHRVVHQGADPALVINAAQQDRTPTDADVSHALDEMLSDAEALTRTLLGGEGRSLAGPTSHGLTPSDVTTDGSAAVGADSRCGTGRTGSVGTGRSCATAAAHRLVLEPNQRRSSATGPPSIEPVG